MSPPKILIVEDELIIAEDISMKLQSLGYEVLECCVDYEEAIACLQEETPDLALLDINLNEELSGIDIARFIRKKYNIPIVFITSNTDPATIEEVSQVKPNGFLVKPFKKEELYALVEVALSSLPEKAAPISSKSFSDTLFIKESHQYTRVRYEEILYLKADGNYTTVHTEKGKHMVRGKLKEVLERLPESFLRLHKSHVVNLLKVQAVQPAFVLIGEVSIPVGKAYRSDLFDKMTFL